VLHTGRIPPTPEDYAQEIGRGGRRGSVCECLIYVSAELVQQTAALVALPRDGADLTVQDAVCANLALGSLQALLRLLLRPGCRRHALLRATVGLELAEGCRPCTSCDRCAPPGMCDLTRGHESETDLEHTARGLLRLMQRRPLTTFADALSCFRWQGIPTGIGCSFTSGALLLAMLAAGCLSMVAREGALPGASSWRTERVLLIPSGRAVSGSGPLGLERVPFGVSLERPLASGRLAQHLLLLAELGHSRAEMARAEERCRLECLRLARLEGCTDTLARLGSAPCISW